LITEVEEAITFIRKNLMVEYIITGEPRRTERYNYPLEAIREVVINMIVHRDYRDSGNSIIKIFDDRIEFFNPGKLYDDLTIEKLQSGNYSSRSRNSAIAKIFKETGMIERYGSGIKRIKNACRAHNIKEPVFEEFQHGFRVIMFNERVSEGVSEGVNEGVNGGAGGLYALILQYPNHRAPFFAETINTSIKNIERWLTQLKKEKKVEFRGPSKTGGYFAI
jgi:ATP-dependent DNA helicase RecG